MSPIQNLPAELLDRVFTIGNDELEIEPYQANQRRLKSFVRAVQGVCTQWRAIIKNNSNPHYWITDLDVNTGFWGQNDMLPHFSQFWSALRQVRGEGIRLSFNIISASDENSAMICLHALRLLMDVRSQIMEIGFYVACRATTPILFAFINQLGPTSRLRRLDLAIHGDDANMKIPTSFSELIGLEDPRNAMEFGTACPLIAGIHLYQVRPTDFVHIPSGITYVSTGTINDQTKWLDF